MPKRNSEPKPEPKNKGGRPKGWDRERARRALQEMVWKAQDAMVEAQIANAMGGVKHLVYRDKKTGKFKAASVGELPALQAAGEVIEVWEEKPNVLAFTDLLNRANGKPVEQVEAEVEHRLEIAWKSSE